MAHEDTLVDGSVSEMEKWGEGRRKEEEGGGRRRERRDDGSIICLFEMVLDYKCWEKDKKNYKLC